MHALLKLWCWAQAPGPKTSVLFPNRNIPTSAQLKIKQTTRQFVIVFFPISNTVTIMVAGYLAKKWLHESAVEIKPISRFWRNQHTFWKDYVLRLMTVGSENRIIFTVILQGKRLQPFHVSLLQSLKSVPPMSWEIPFLPQRSMLVHWVVSLEER